MTKLLIPEPPLQVLPSLACEIGLNEAIFTQQLHYLLRQFGKERDGQKWIYNTYQEWGETFPFWSKNTIVRTIKNLEDKGIILSANYNKMSIDRTKWYTIDYSHFGNPSDHLPKMGKPSTQDGSMSFTQNGSTNNQRLPETNIQETTATASSGSDEQTEGSEYQLPELKDPAEHTRLCNLMEDNGFGLVTEILRSDLDDVMEQYPPVEIETAIKIAVRKGKPFWAYVAGILKRGVNSTRPAWRNGNGTQPTEADYDEAARKYTTELSFSIEDIAD